MQMLIFCMHALAYSWCVNQRMCVYGNEDFDRVYCSTTFISALNSMAFNFNIHYFVCLLFQLCVFALSFSHSNHTGFFFCCCIPHWIDRILCAENNFLTCSKRTFDKKMQAIQRQSITQSLNLFHDHER